MNLHAFLQITYMVMLLVEGVVLMNYELLFGLAALVSALASLIWSVRRKA
jgi:hypothetical protein